MIISGSGPSSLGDLSCGEGVARKKCRGFGFGGFVEFWAYFIHYYAFITESDSFGGGLNPQVPTNYSRGCGFSASYRSTVLLLT